MSGPVAGRLPDGYVAVWDRRVRRLGGGAVIAGSPPALLRLRPAAWELFDGDRLTVRDATTAALARRLVDCGAAVPQLLACPVDPVTVVIPVRDDAAGLGRLLDALRHTAPEHPVLVVDDGSTPPVRLDRPGVTVLRHPVSRGPAAARNTGLAAADTELVAFCDADTVPTEPGWLDALAAQFADPALAMVAPRITALDAGAGWLADYERVRSSLDLGPDPGPVCPGAAVSYVPSAVLVVRAPVVRPGFDESLHVAEDVDLVFRLHAAGHRMRYVPSVTVAHRHRTRVWPWLARKAFYGTGAAALADRHPGQVPPVRLSPWTGVAMGALLLGRRWSVPVAAGAAGVAWWRLRGGLPVPRPGPAAARLVALGFGGAAWQVGSAIVRHWWPATAALCVVSRRARVAAAVAALAEGVVDHRLRGRDTGLIGYLVAHRLDDLAYGAGVWWGALRARTGAALVPSVQLTATSSRSVPVRSEGRVTVGSGALARVRRGVRRR